MSSPTTVTLDEVRLSYCNLFQPKVPQSGGDPKYSVTILVSKANTATKAVLDAAIAAALERGVTKSWNGVRPPVPAICVHDGDGVRPSDGAPYSAECRGCWVLTASSKNAPFVVDAGVNPIMQATEVYSGMYGRANVTFFPYNNAGKKGVGCALNGVQKLRDGEPLVDRVTAQEAFSPAQPTSYGF